MNLNRTVLSRGFMVRFGSNQNIADCYLRLGTATPLQSSCSSRLGLLPGSSRLLSLAPSTAYAPSPHGGERVRLADQAVVSKHVGRVSETDRIDKEPHARVKGEFVGTMVPSDGNWRSQIRRAGRRKPDQMDPEGIRPDPV